MQINGTTQPVNSSLAIFAHEMREPLASILLAVQAVGETVSDSPTSREMWGIVERQSRYLARLIDQVMEPSRGSQGKVTLSREWFDLDAMIMNAVETVKPLMTGRRHRLTVSLPSAPTFMLADALRMQQVVINLLANAAKYTEPGGQITLGLETVNGTVVIEVHDNGMGIPAELLPHVFDLFRQGGKTRVGGASGLGIGLALVKSLVELHGGSVSAHSNGTGAGSTFVVMVPEIEPKVGKRQVGVAGRPDVPGVEPAWAANPMLDA